METDGHNRIHVKKTITLWTVAEHGGTHMKTFTDMPCVAMRRMMGRFDHERGPPWLGRHWARASERNVSAKHVETRVSQNFRVEVVFIPEKTTIHENVPDMFSISVFSRRAHNKH